jgi:hypothetical protein
MKAKQASGTLTLVCTATGREIDSGVLYTADDFERARAAKLLLHCRYCGASHLFKFSEARLRPLRRG